METNFCGCGGCTAKLPPQILQAILPDIPRNYDKNLIIGFDTSDDAAVYKLSEDIALIQTIDFFPAVTKDPYMFGKIAAANALSDIYAMNGEIKIALNIVCFPENSDTSILKDILRGGAEKVQEAGGILCGGHSIADNDIKYGLSVTGTANPKNILANNTCKLNDKVILTKPLGVGIISAAYGMDAVSEAAYRIALTQMETLNKYAAEKMKKYMVHACTDVTGFGFLGHLYEMTRKDISINVEAVKIPYIEEAYLCAEEFYITSGGQKNRNYLKGKVKLRDISFAMSEILYDPQTSGGLLISVDSRDANSLLDDLNTLEIRSEIVGTVVERAEASIIVE